MNSAQATISGTRMRFGTRGASNGALVETGGEGDVMGRVTVSST
jgi:hypothetical protein